METHYYTCVYCKKQYIPTRRKVQKFCSASCKTRHHQVSKGLKSSQAITPANPTQDSKATQVEKISAAGIGNAAIGTTAADFIKSLLTKEENKSATKGDVQRLAEKLKRFHKIQNMGPNSAGQSAYFDIELGMVVYRFDS